jgi:hypothetical protein
MIFVPTFGSTFGSTLRTQRLVPTVCAAVSRAYTHIAAPSNFLIHAQISAERTRELNLTNMACDVVVVVLSRGTSAGEMLCRHMHKQARSASLPCQTFDAPHVTLLTTADHQKKHVWHKQAANRIGKSHRI